MKIETKRLYNLCAILLSIAFVLIVFNGFLCDAQRRYDSFEEVKLSVAEKSSYQEGDDPIYYVKLKLMIRNDANYVLKGWDGIMTVKNQSGKALCTSELELGFSFSSSKIEVGEARYVDATVKYLRLDENAAEFFSADKEQLTFIFEPTEISIYDNDTEYLDADKGVYAYALSKMFPLSIISIPINGLLLSGVIYAAYIISKRIGKHFAWED